MIFLALHLEQREKNKGRTTQNTMANSGRFQEEEIAKVIWETVPHEKNEELFQRAIELILADPGANPNPCDEKSGDGPGFE